MAATGSDDGLAMAAEALAGRPDFADVVARHCRDMLGFYERQPLAGLILGDIGRLAIVAAVLGTERQLRSQLVRALGTGLASRSRVEAHLETMSGLGLVELAETQGGVAVAATDALRRLMDDWICAMTGCIVQVFPETAAAAAHEDAAVHYLRQIIEAHGRGFSAFAYVPALAPVMALRGGYLLVLQLALQHFERGGRFSRKAFAKRFRLTRSHVVDLVGECRAADLIEPGHGNLLVGSDLLVAQARRWVAIHVHLGRATLAQSLATEIDASTASRTA
jgi:DNA-binding transcriptional ArsR family regulator